MTLIGLFCKNIDVAIVILMWLFFDSLIFMVLLLAKRTTFPKHLDRNS